MIGGGGALKKIVAAAAYNVFDAGEIVAMAVDNCKIGLEVGLNATRRRREVGRVAAGATVESILAASAGEGVVAAIAVEMIVEGITGKHVVAGRTHDVCDANQRIGAAIAVGAAVPAARSSVTGPAAAE